MTWVEIITFSTSIVTILFALGSLIYREVKGRVNNRNLEISYSSVPQVKDGVLYSSAIISVYNKMCKPALITEISLYDEKQVISIATNQKDGVFEWLIPSGVRLTTKFTLESQPSSQNCELKFTINGNPLTVQISNKDTFTV